jgi:hypothetical protein
MALKNLLLSSPGHWRRCDLMGDQWRNEMRSVLLVIIVIGTISSAHAQYGANYRTCSNLTPVCINNYAKQANASARCNAVRVECMRTGIWTGLDGRTIVSAEKK